MPNRMKMKIKLSIVAFGVFVDITNWGIRGI